MRRNRMVSHIVNDKEKEVYFLIPNGMPTTMLIPTWMKSFPPDYKGLVVRTKDHFDRLRKEVENNE
tara:strand:- start:139 stop:336 length:198 start_codon:yes stop_codon:yes gene_type:complete